MSVPVAVSNRPPVWLWFVAGVLVMQATVSQADALSGDNWRAYVQFNQIANYTTDNNYAGQSDDRINTEFRDLLIGGTYDFTPEWSASLQAISRRFGRLADGRVEMDFGYLTWQPINNFEWAAGVRVGKVRSNYGFYNATRDNAFTRPSIILPQSIYSETDRNILFSQTGAHVFAEYRTGDHDFDVDLAYFRPHVGEAENEAINGDGEIYGYQEGDNSYSLSIGHDWNAGELRWRLSHNHINYQYYPGTFAYLIRGPAYYRSTLLSLEYNDVKWSLTTELERFVNDSSQIYSDLLKQVLDTNGSPVGSSRYLQFSYRPIPKWDLVIRYDVVYLDNQHHDDGYLYAKDAMLGFGYRPTPHWMLRAEFHNIEGDAWLTSMEQADPFNTPKYWNMLLFQISYLR